MSRYSDTELLQLAVDIINEEFFIYGQMLSVELFAQLLEKIFVDEIDNA